MTLGEKIRNRRKELGIKQTELAEMVLVSQPAINQIENDVKGPSSALLFRIADALGCKADDLRG